MNARRVGLLAGLVCFGCGGEDEAGSGTLQVTAYGEAFVEEGIPASSVDDGWQVTFDQFVVRVSDLHIAGQDLPDPEPVDLSAPSAGVGQVLAARAVPSGRYDDARFTLRSLHVVGRASKGSEEKSFDWTFDEPVHYHACETTTEVKADAVGTFQITLHADHLLYDSLVSEAPKLGFQAFADADTGDGAISPDELAQADIGGFDPGNEEIEDLWHWLLALAKTVGHVDGEGHCHAEVAE